MYNDAKGNHMKNGIFLFSLIVAFVFSGCATNNGPEYDGSSYSQIKHYDIGVVTSAKAVVITDDGTGKFFGALIGAVLGNAAGNGNGIAALGGGLAGYYAGSQAGKANGDELTVKLDNGKRIVVVVKGNKFKVGDKIKIIKDGNKVARVDYAEK